MHGRATPPYPLVNDMFMKPLENHWTLAIEIQFVVAAVAKDFALLGLRTVRMHGDYAGLFQVALLQLHPLVGPPYPVDVLVREH